MEFVGEEFYRIKGWFPLDLSGWLDPSLATTAAVSAQTEFWGMMTW